MKYLIALIFLILVLPAACGAQAVTIGQIQSEGASANDEFVELVNSSEEAAPLGAWSIQYRSAAGTAFYKKNFIKEASIAASGRYVVCGTAYAGACDMRHSSFSLSSAGGTVFLVADQALLTSPSASSVVDQKTYGPAEAKPPEAVTPPTEDLTPPSPYQGEGAKTPTARTAVINELMATPSEGEEWIELYNPTGYAVELGGWTLADGTSKSFAALEGIIAPAGFKQVMLDSSRLNGSGDILILRDGKGSEIDKVAYGDWKDDAANAPTGGANISVARIGDGVDRDRDNEDFALTSTPTPGLPNLISPPSGQASARTPPTPSSTKRGSETIDFNWLADLIENKNGELADLLRTNKNIIIVNNLYIGTDGAVTTNSKQLNPPPKADQPRAGKSNAETIITKATTTPKPTNVVEGQIIAPVGLTGKDMAIVREADRSVEVRLPKDLKSAPETGDIVRASGSWSAAKTLTLPRLLVKTASAFSVTGHDEVAAPVAIAFSEVGRHLGEIVTIEGAVVEKQPTRFRIADGDASVLIKQAFAAQKGDRISATGLLAKSGEDLILTPLSSSSIAIANPLPLPKPLAKRAVPYALALIPAGLLMGTVWLGKRYGKWKGGESP